MKKKLLRRSLYILMLAGGLSVMIGPCSYMLHEGAGGPPPPMAETIRMRRLAYIWVATGVVVAIVSGVVLVVIDRTQVDHDQ